MRKKTNIAVLETGHILEGYPAAGDKVLEEMAKRLPSKYHFKILVPKIGAQHWRESGLDVEYCLIPATPYDNQTNPVLIFLTYLLRMWHVFWQLKNLSSIEIIYSSTHVLPDILPAYILKKMRPDLIWITKIHHLVLSPIARPGNLLVNIVSSFMEKISLSCLKNVGALIMVNNAGLRSKLSQKGFNKGKIQILGGGIEWGKISKFKPVKGADFDAVFLGRLHPVKGIFDILPIWRGVVKKIPQAKLAIIGNGPLEIKRKLKNKVKEAYLSKNVKIFGFLPYADVLSIMKQAKAFLFLDYEAGWGLAVAEAMACGLPVIGYNSGVLGTVYHQGFIKVPLGDKKKFFHQVIKLLKNEGKRAILSQEARQESAKFDWSITSQQFGLFLENILQKG